MSHRESGATVDAISGRSSAQQPPLTPQSATEGASTSASVALAAHAPVGRWARNTIFLYLFVAVFAGMRVLPIALSIAGVLLVRAFWVRAYQTALGGLTASFHQIGLGQLGEASAILDVVQRFMVLTWMKRLLDVQRATIAIRAGRFRDAIAPLSQAVERPVGWVRRSFCRYQAASAQSLRAFAHASLGDRDAARRDIEQVRSNAESDADALARVTLAELLVLHQEGRRDELRLLLHKQRPLLYEHTHPRERAVVRALARMLEEQPKSVYRRGAAEIPSAPNGQEPALADWMEAVLPGSRNTLGAHRRRVLPAGEVLSNGVVPTEAGTRAVVAARAAGERRQQTRDSGRTQHMIALGLGLGGAAALAAAAAATQSSALNAPTATSATMIAVLAVTGCTATALIVAGHRLRRVWLGRRHRAQLGPATAFGDGSKQARRQTRYELVALTGSPDAKVASQAHLMLATLAEREGDMRTALRHTERGIASATAISRRETGWLESDLISLRAYALAALGRREEADAELAGLNRSYPYHAHAVYRARLMGMISAGQLEGAANWARQRALDLPLSLREEALTDLVLAHVEPETMGAVERDRLRRELRRDDELRQWVETVAPRLLDSREEDGSARGQRIALSLDEATDDDLLAEEEAEQAIPTGERRSHL